MFLCWVEILYFYNKTHTHTQTLSHSPKPGIATWHAEYYRMLDRYMLHGRFAGNKLLLTLKNTTIPSCSSPPPPTQKQTCTRTQTHTRSHTHVRSARYSSAWAATCNCDFYYLSGKDQSIMASVCLYKSGLCHLVQPPTNWKLESKTQTRENPWFYLQDYLL
jgi:hypothetical protein